MDGVGDGMRFDSTVEMMFFFQVREEHGEESNCHARSSICSCLEFLTDLGEVRI